MIGSASAIAPALDVNDRMIIQEVLVDKGHVLFPIHGEARNRIGFFIEVRSSPFHWVVVELPRAPTLLHYDLRNEFGDF